MALATYRSKRNFRLTPEPRGGRVRKSADRPLAFVVQKHAASHLHYDFRLELDGVLLSWAVPKGPSLKPTDKRLALQTEDHPLEYGGFEGIIPERQYGGGTVMVWDRGTWQAQGDPREGLARGTLKFELHGEKLNGHWVLVRTHGRNHARTGGKTAWLLIKERDAFAQTNGAPLVTDAAPDSVVSGRSLDGIARARNRVWQSKLSVRQNIAAGALEQTKAPARRVRATARANAVAAARPTPMPRTLSPMLCTLVDTAPAGDEWVHEVKFDGYRMLARVARGSARLVSRNGKDWTPVLQTLAQQLGELPVKSAWIDGEVCKLDADGKTSFQALQNALSSRDPELAFFAFDLLYVDGHDLRQQPLAERKRLLRAIVGKGRDAIRLGPEVAGDGAEFFRQACTLGLEGIVSKRAGSIYRDGERTRDWVKVKCLQRQELVIGGFTEPQGARKGFGALLLGVHDQGELRYAGKVGTGFDEKTIASLYPLLRQRERSTPAFANPPRGFAAKGAHWVTPDLVAEVAFTEWSADGALRHPSFQGLRADKSATDVVREKPVTGPLNRARARVSETTSRARGTREVASTNSPDRAKRAGDEATIAGVALSHPDKVLFPEAKLTKRDIAEHYAFVAPWLLPHLAGRPLSLVRCPDGWRKQCFYQKHAVPSVHASVARIEVPEGGGTATYMGVRSARSIVALVQWGVLEFHPWGSRTPRLDRPDRLVFDFDPAEESAWQDLVRAVTLLKALLDDLGLQSFLKTTGGKGLHIVVPIRPTLDWPQAKGFTAVIAALLVHALPDILTTRLAKAQRKGRIFVDTLRNGEGATAVAPYVVRARTGAPVATPIGFDELARDVRFDHFNVGNLRDRLSGATPDPWQMFASVRQTVTRKIAQRVGFDLD